MIYDSLKNAALYRALGPRYAVAFDYLATFDAATPDGRVPLDGDQVFALVQSYVTGLPDQRPFESHRLYADVQYVAVGEEIIYVAPLDQLVVTTPYVEDATLYRGMDDLPLRLRAGDFALLSPQDGHKPCCQWRAPSSVKKVVVKVRV